MGRRTTRWRGQSLPRWHSPERASGRETGTAAGRDAPVSRIGLRIPCWASGFPAALVGRERRVNKLAPVVAGGSAVVVHQRPATLSDVRVVDGVPTDLAVLDGSPRGGETLTAGESVAIEYTLIARRGEHDFDEPRLRVRGTGAGESRLRRDTPEAMTGWCAVGRAGAAAVRRGTDRVGQLTTDAPGDGLPSTRRGSISAGTRPAASTGAATRSAESCRRSTTSRGYRRRSCSSSMPVR